MEAAAGLGGHMGSPCRRVEIEDMDKARAPDINDGRELNSLLVGAMSARCEWLRIKVGGGGGVRSGDLIFVERRRRISPLCRQIIFILMNICSTLVNIYSSR
jgi:hypothetical protein